MATTKPRLIDKDHGKQTAASLAKDAKDAARDEAGHDGVPVAEPKVMSSVGRFTFTMRVVPKVPELVRTPPKQNSLPFKGWFPHMVHNGEIFVPLAFWTESKEQGGRGVAVDKATSAYQRAKIGDAFRAWKATDDAYKNRVLVQYYRRKGDLNSDGVPYEDDGMSIFMLINDEDKPKVPDSNE